MTGENFGTILISGGVGIILGGLVQIAVSRHAAFQESKGIAAALRAEIESIIRLIEHRKYVDSLKDVIKSLENPAHEVTPSDIFTFRVSENPYGIFDALCHKIGLLGDVSGPVVSFYVLAKSLVVGISDLWEIREKALAGDLPLTHGELLDFTKQMAGIFEEVALSGHRAASNLAAYERRRWLLFLP